MANTNGHAYKKLLDTAIKYYGTWMNILENISISEKIAKTEPGNASAPKLDDTVVRHIC